MKPSVTTLLRTATLVAPLMLLTTPASAQDFDLTGEWVLTVESPNGTGTREMTLEQEGNKLTGTIASSMAVGEITGMVEENKISFVALVAMDAGMFEVAYECTFEDGEMVGGTVNFGEYGSGTFTGVRKETGSD